MRKTIFISAVALLGLVACTREYTAAPDGSSNGQPISFRVAVGNLTKSGERAYQGTDASPLKITAVASFYNANGEALAPSVFSDSYGAPEYNAFTKKSSGSWTFDDELLFPLGNDVRLDLLAVASYLDTPADFTTVDHLNAGSAITTYQGHDGTWKPYFSDENNYTKMVRFFYVDTWKNPTDLMYASANNIDKRNATDVPLLFKHATANLIFNICFTYENTSTTGIDFRNIIFIDGNQAKWAPYLTGYPTSGSSLESNLVSSDITLKTIGSLTIDNSKNKIEASWETYPRDDTDGWGVNDIVGQLSMLNDNTFLASTYPNFVTNFAAPTTVLTPGNTFSTATWYQLGDEMLIPEQPKVNFWLYYVMNNKQYIHEVNIPRGTWQMGKSYIYNIELVFSSATFACSVEEWVPGDLHEASI